MQAILPQRHTAKHADSTKSLGCSTIPYHTTVAKAPVGRQGSSTVVWWCGMVKVCEGVPVAVDGWVLADRHDLAPCATNSLHRVTIPNNVTGGTWGAASWQRVQHSPNEPTSSHQIQIMLEPNVRRMRLRLRQHRTVCHRHDVVEILN